MWTAAVSRRKASTKRPKRPPPPRRPKPVVVGITRQELAKRLLCNPRSISRWLEDGLPVAVPGRGGHATRFDESQVRAWLKAREAATQAATGWSGAQTAKARRDLAQALESEQRLAIRARTLVPAEDVERVWSAQVSAVRTRLLAIPIAWSDRLHRAAVTGGPAAVEVILQTAVDQVLTELSTDVSAAP